MWGHLHVPLLGDKMLTFQTILFTGKDIIGLAETGSGKTGAFALPVLQTLLENPQRLYALILTPTRFVHLIVYTVDLKKLKPEKDAKKELRLDRIRSLI